MLRKSGSEWQSTMGMGNTTAPFVYQPLTVTLNEYTAHTLRGSQFIPGNGPRVSQTQSVKTNPLASSLTPPHQPLDKISCTCRRHPLTGRCENAEDWLGYILPPAEEISNRIMSQSQLRKAYEGMLKMPHTPEDEKQIASDVTRTFPELKVYNTNKLEAAKLTNVLTALAVRWPVIGYVQGMNFIVASLLYHLSEEYLAFWVFGHLVSCLQLEELYKKGLPALQFHSLNVQKLISARLPRLSDRLYRAGITPDLFLTEWLLPLGCYHIPLALTGHFLRIFLRHGWQFLYSLITQFLLLIESPLLLLDDMDLLQSIKAYSHHGAKPEALHPFLHKIDWLQAILDAKAYFHY